eukprot:CAMPEP_0172470588 /NCGR_PEP_ID=MMETSP1065-20121228/66750_1 /TAXON_ID=265537 /ORGANISM="Amphiprora paludosa, Strain CCMP125" /LENGTH=148 /DNA_ID=CAMNT_0013228581 /DNA_START=252 /DNA_END=694 /DNA_ORIENTATION=+
MTSHDNEHKTLGCPRPLAGDQLHFSVRHGSSLLSSTNNMMMRAFLCLLIHFHGLFVVVQGSFECVLTRLDEDVETNNRIECDSFCCSNQNNNIVVALASNQQVAPANGMGVSLNALNGNDIIDVDTSTFTDPGLFLIIDGGNGNDTMT